MKSVLNVNPFPICPNPSFMSRLPAEVIAVVWGGVRSGEGREWLDRN